MLRILILTALQKELDAVINTLKSPLQEVQSKQIDGYVYYIFNSNNTEIFCTSMIGMGQVNSALATYRSIMKNDFDFVILTGICGGIDKSLNLGDLVVSDQIVDYEIAKVYNNKSDIRWNVYKSDARLLHQLKNYNSIIWKRFLLDKFPDKVANPNVSFGTVLSGNKIIASEKEAIRLTIAWDKALAVEMEGAGAAASLNQVQKSPGFIMIKSVCDFADSNKNDDWQEYACYASAAYAISFLFNNIIDERKHFKAENAEDMLNTKLKYILRESFNLSELKVLAFDINIDFDEIIGESKSDKIVELINYCKRRNKLNNLIDAIRNEREFIDI